MTLPKNQLLESWFNTSRTIPADILGDFIGDTLCSAFGSTEPGLIKYLILGTAAAESRMGFFNRQIRGPAIGMFQMEPNTAMDIIQNYVAYRNSMKDAIKTVTDCDTSNRPAFIKELEFTPELQTVMCGIHYRRRKAQLTDREPETLAAIWKEKYNTYKGKGTVEHFVRAYNRYITPFIGE
jgi:hypothetical protein